MSEETKETLSTKLNELLKTNIKFDKLSKEELVQLWEAIGKIKDVEAAAMLPLLDRPIGEILDKKVMNRPLRDLTLSEVFGIPKERVKGFLGLGVLPRIFAAREEEKKA